MNRFKHSVIALLLSVSLALPVSVTAKAPSQASVERLIEMSGGDELFEQVYAQMEQLMQAAMVEAQAGKPMTKQQQQVAANFNKQFSVIMREEMGWDTLGPMMVRIYKNNFNQREIDGLIDFYASDIGKAFVAKMPQVTADSMQQVMSLMPAVTERLDVLMADMQREMEAAKGN